MSRPAAGSALDLAAAVELAGSFCVFAVVVKEERANEVEVLAARALEGIHLNAVFTWSLEEPGTFLHPKAPVPKGQIARLRLADSKEDEDYNVISIYVYFMHVLVF